MYSHNWEKDEFERKCSELNKLSLTLSAKYILYNSADFYLEIQKFRDSLMI